MRKLISIAIVTLMMLTLFLGLFGGVFEEAEGVAVYDPVSNTIYVSDPSTRLVDIYIDLLFSAPGVFNFYPSTGIYTTNASIQITDTGELDIVYSSTEQALLFDFNSTRLLNLTVIGTLTVTGLESEFFRFDSNSSSPNKGDWQGLTFLGSVASNSVINYAGVFNASIGIKCENSDPTISNSVISENSENGIYIENSSPIIERNQILNNGKIGFEYGGIYVIDSTLTVENCTLDNSPYDDFILFGSSSIANLTTLNCTFDDNEVSSTGSYQLTVKWYLDVLVKNNDTGEPIPEAVVYIENKTGAPVGGSPFTTDSNGHKSWIKVIEYIEDTSGNIPHTPHNITVTHDEYYTGYADPEPYMDSSKQAQVNLTMIRRDLTTNQENITFKPSGTPVADEELTIYAKIHNIEVDDVEDVRVVIVDEAPEGNKEIHNSTISKIEGNNYKNAVDVWQPTPGDHTIWVYIDPFNEIMEINSDPGIDAEANNNASTFISVNARPIVNITEPEEDDEVNGTVFITGTAYDDPADDMMGSNITRVDIRLENYDWIELYIGPNLTYNFFLGIWEWHYGWDTTQWNGTSLSDGNYTINARAWDNYHYSNIDMVNIAINNTGANMPPDAIISSPTEPNAFNVSDLITFNGSGSIDDQTSPENLNYSWDFDAAVDTNGDGNFTNDEDAYGNITTHAYDKKGLFDVTLKVTDEGDLNDTAFVTVNIWNYRPVANITVSNTTAYENHTITFNGTGSYDPDGFVDSYLWDFDDGTYSTMPIWDHAFNESRIFNVTLTVTDSNLTSNFTWILITVLPNEAPIPIIDEPTVNEAFSVNETIVFNASSSSDPNADPIEYFWDFGDGTNSSWITETITIHHYSDYGPNVLPEPLFSYTVTLFVRDIWGLTSSETVYVIVDNYPPVAILTSNVSTSPTNQDITFDGSASYDPDSLIENYTWDFGDGETYTELLGEPQFDGVTTHQYADNGAYTVTLTVTDNAPTTNPARNSTVISVTITNRAPTIINATASPQSARIDEDIYFNVTASDSDGNITKYEWDFDGNSFYDWSSTTTGNTTHSFGTKGEYTARVRITDDDDATNTMDVTVNIVNTPPEVIIEYPTEDEEVDGIYTIEGTASDPDGDSITEVQVKIDEDGEWISASGTTSWSWDWDTTDVDNGRHTIYVRSYDDIDYSQEFPRNVTVGNPATRIETVTVNLNPSTVETGGTVEVSGVATYDNGDPVDGADVNITILNQPGYWVTSTSIDGEYNQLITAPYSTGSHSVRVKVDDGEYSKTESESLYVTTPTDQPDLAISYDDIVFYPSNPYSGDTVQITVIVRNIGNADANNFLVNAYDGDPDVGGIPIDSESISVSAKDNETVSLYWVTSGITGQRNVYVVLDPSETITESDEANNEAYKLITVQGKPDFAVDSEDITFSKSDPKVGETISIVVRIRNDGAKSETVKYEIYDGNPEAGGLIIDSGQVYISDDDYETIYPQWTIEESGVHDIYVLLDPDDDIDESDETNNDASSSITVEALPGEEGIPPWLLPLIVILAVVVVVIILILNFRGKKPKPEQKLPLAQVVQKEAKSKVVEVKEDEEDKETSAESHGMIRIG